MPESHSHTGLGNVPRQTGDAEELRPPLRFYLMLVSIFAIVTVMAAYHYAVRGLRRQPVDDRFVVPAADADRGRAMLRVHGCIGCHTIPGVPGAEGRVGPRLDQLREQAYIAGVLPNSPQNLVTWIEHPKDVDPRTAMPDLGVSPTDARDMAAYLYSIR